jgi:hypothetical protein
MARLTCGQGGVGVRWAHHVQALKADTTGFIVD